MIARYRTLSGYPRVFKSMTGLEVWEFWELEKDMAGRFEAAETQRLKRANRQRAIGGGDVSELDMTDQLLMTVIWLRQYPIYEVLGYLFGVSDSTVSRYVSRMVPLLAASGRDTMKMPDPGRKRRRQLDDLLRETPDLAVIIDSFEQRVQRPKERALADGHYSGKKKAHTLKCQIAIDESSGRIVDVSASVPGPTADITLLDQSGLLQRLPDGVGALADLAYVGADKRQPGVPVATPRRKPRGRDRPPDDIAFNRAFARRRIRVEHSIGRLRRYRALDQLDRHHRSCHSLRTAAVAGLVNRCLASRSPYA